MTLNASLLKARHVGVRRFRTTLSAAMHHSKPLVVTEHGVAKKVLVDYHDIVELAEMMDEIQDREALQLVSKGKQAMSHGFRGIPIESSFAKIRSLRKAAP
jgi:cyclopropane fatty-acyl-phospholipid synthase-like methyltransferase